ncbi:hypothetical protein BHM03_00000406 [Ensete ventricosum]|nr:hypothetical protein BHM03_00000406 [Ensete ventricosum]
MIVFSFFVPDETQDAAHQDEQTSRVRDWINSRHITTIDLADILANFPDISLVKIDILLLNFDSGINSKACTVKEEAEMQDITNSEKTCNNFEDDFVYMKVTRHPALYFALPMDYVTISKLQSKLAGVANHSTVRKLIDKMEQDGYIKNTGNRRLGYWRSIPTAKHLNSIIWSSLPVSYNLQPIASLESGVVGERPNAMTLCAGDVSNSTEDKRLRKASTVEEPILQYVKRQKSQA